MVNIFNESGDTAELLQLRAENNILIHKISIIQRDFEERGKIIAKYAERIEGKERTITCIMDEASEQSNYNRGYLCGLAEAMKIAEKNEDYYEEKCSNVWPDMQPNAVEGCKSVYWEIEVAIEDNKKAHLREP